MNPKRWLKQHSLKILAITDTPEAIAGGVAIGIFFGFTPLFGLKTLLTLFFAWLSGSNIIAAVIAATAHDVILPLMPAVYLWQYDLGYWLLSSPHEWPRSMFKVDLHGHLWRSWTTFFSIGRPLLVGSLLCAGPVALVTFFVTRTIIVRHRRHKAKHEKAGGEEHPFQAD